MVTLCMYRGGTDGLPMDGEAQKSDVTQLDGKPEDEVDGLEASTGKL